MELHLKINDVVGMDDEKRHILRVDGEQLIAALMEHKGWLAQNVVKEWLLKHNTRLLNEIIDDPTPVDIYPIIFDWTPTMAIGNPPFTNEK